MITIREMRKDETPLLIKWLHAHRDVNRVDPEPFRRNQVRIYVAEDESGIIAFIPIQLVYMFDALAPRPNVESERLAQAFQAIDFFLNKEAKRQNIGKAYVQPSDSKFSKFIQKHFGYKPVTYETLELKFSTRESEFVSCESIQ